MKTTIFSLIIFTLSASLFAQKQPKKVYRITQEMYSNEWYKTQSGLWEKEIQKNPQNAKAWENYYNAKRYAHFENIDSKARKEKLGDIIDRMGKAIPGSYEHTLLKAWNEHKINDIRAELEAFELDPSRPAPLWNMISHYEIHGKMDKVRETYQKIYDLQGNIPELLDYNYNVLESLEADAILFTNGDNDTYPARMLQEVKNVRSDITIINTSLGTIDTYLDRKLEQKKIKVDAKAIKKASLENGQFSKPLYITNLVKEIVAKHPDLPLYFASTVSRPFLQEFEEELYNTGLAMRYSAGKLDNVALLKKNLEQRFRLNNLESSWYREEYVGKHMMAKINMNYIPAMIVLAEHYNLSEETVKKDLWKNRALNLAKAAGEKSLIDYIKEKGL